MAVDFVCDKGFAAQARGIMQRPSVPVVVHTITAGKFRRYAHMSALRQLLMPRLVWANLTDIVKVVVGTVQALGLVRRLRPDVVFAKGGFVCIPVGVAARVWRVPLVIHDSDARPGLTNRILSRWAAAIATGSPLDNYPYDRAISHHTGVPIDAQFQPLSESQQRAAKQSLGLPADRLLVVATGGGLGAVSINQAMLGAAEALLADGIVLYHVTGKAHYEAVRAAAPQHEQYHITPFVYQGMAQLLGAADVVITRGSSTFTQELAGLAKAAIIVPARQLGDQRKNAAVFAKAGAGLVLSDDEIETPGTLYRALQGLLADPDRRQRLAQALHGFARPQAARDVARLIDRVVMGPNQGADSNR